LRLAPRGMDPVPAPKSIGASEDLDVVRVPTSPQLRYL
jgi:hypothetical protein